jgi:hypothetical protein
VNGQCLRHISVQRKAHCKIVGRANQHAAGGMACFAKRCSHLRPGRGRFNDQQCAFRLGLESVEVEHGRGTARRKSEATGHNSEGSITGCQVSAHGRSQHFDYLSSDTPHHTIAAYQLSILWRRCHGQQSPLLGFPAFCVVRHWQSYAHATTAVSRFPWAKRALPRSAKYFGLLRLRRREADLPGVSLTQVSPRPMLPSPATPPLRPALASTRELPSLTRLFRVSVLKPARRGMSARAAARN